MFQFVAIIFKFTLFNHLDFLSPLVFLKALHCLELFFHCSRLVLPSLYLFIKFPKNATPRIFEWLFCVIILDLKFVKAKNFPLFLIHLIIFISYLRYLSDS